MTKRLSEQQFATASTTLNKSPNAVNIARRVLVLGEAQRAVASSIDSTPQYVSLIVNDFWHHYKKHYCAPTSWVTEVVTLPSHYWASVHLLIQKAHEEQAKPRNRLAKATGKAASV